MPPSGDVAPASGLAESCVMPPVSDPSSSASASAPRVNDVLASALKTNGVEVMFGVMGDANMYVVDSFQRNEGGRYLSSANEAGAVQMASGYAAVTGRVGVATVTHGAIANAVSALFEASRGHYPVLVVAGDTAREQGFHLQNIPQREVVVPTGAAYREVRGVATVEADLLAALSQALGERRPVVLDLPADFQQAVAVGADRVPAPRRVPGVLTPRREDLEEAAAVIMSAHRPLVLAGRGAAAPGTGEVLRAFATRIGAPVMTTLRGKDLFAGDPFDLGIFGTLANPIGSEVIGNADCVVAFGAALSSLTTLRGELLLGKRVIQVDTDQAAHGRYFPVDVAVSGDVAVTAGLLLELLDEAEAPPAHGRDDRLASRISAWRDQDRASADQAQGPLTLTGVLHRIDRLLPAGRSLSIDGGRFSHEALRIMSVTHPWHYAHCLNVGHIGMSVGHGIGAAVGRPQAPALVIAGDGGFMLGGLAEFNTAVRHHLDLVVVLLNDSAYGAEYYRFVAQDLDPKPTTFEWPGFAGVADALGGTGVRIEDWSDFDRLAAAIGPGAGPVLAEVILDVDAIEDPGEH